MKLKLFVPDDLWVADRECLPLLLPLLKDAVDTSRPPDHDRCDDYRREGRNIFEVVSCMDADAFLYPYEWQAGQSNRDVYCLAEKAARHGKPLILFFITDSDEEIGVPNTIIFRTSLSNTKRRPNEFASPCWSRDFLRAYFDNRCPVREKADVPTVGYVGYVDYHNLRSYLWNLASFLRHGRRHPGKCVRGAALRYLKMSPRVHCRIVIRDGFWGSVCSADQRQEFVQNMLNSDYLLVARGGGNFSYRLYEVMSCGRIPLFINTDCVLPFDHLINWTQHFLWVEVAELSRIAEKVVDYHSCLSGDEFKHRQLAVRRLYEEWICPSGFYANLWRCLPQFSGASPRQC